MLEYITLRPESSENIPILFQGADLYFSNQNDLRNPKMGSKHSVVVPPYYWFFQKTVFRQKKMLKKLDWFLNSYGNTYGQIRPVLRNLIAGRSESVEILPKCQKLSNFSISDFLFLKNNCLRSRKAYCSYNGKKTSDFQK